MRGSFNYSGFVDIVTDGRRSATPPPRPSRPTQTSGANGAQLSLAVKAAASPQAKAKPAA